MDKFSWLSGSNPEQIEDIYQQFLKNPEEVEESWRKFFEGFEFARTDYSPSLTTKELYLDEFKVINLITAYRQRGHLFTETNPVRKRRTYTPNLDIEHFGLTNDDLNKEFQAGSEIGIGKAKLKDIISHLKETYCKSVGAEYMYIRKPEIHQWLKQRMESTKNTYNFTLEDRKYIYKNLSRAVLFEKFIHKKFPGQKRFSLEGAEALIPALDAIIEKGALVGAKEFVIGMPHRGRLNVLANIMKKPFHDIFSEFEGKEYEDESLLGDVKYHLGFVIERQTTTGKNVMLTLSPNPSHLEAVGPIVQGIARAKVDKDFDGDYDKVVPILMHGDASVAGQGIVYEVLQMSGLTGYKTGGTVHLVVNNQVGFTTDYLDARTSTYCTDVAKTIHAPVFHVNGDDVEALVYTIQLAMEYREKFNNDVFIDILCYRKYGHNEGDEPRFTQPILYKVIEKHPDPMTIYRDKLLQQGILKSEDLDKIITHLNEVFEENFAEAKQTEKVDIAFIQHKWKNIRKAKPEDFIKSPNTGVAENIIRDIGNKLTHIPEGKKLFRKIVRLQENRRTMLDGEGSLDWAMGELLAYASLMKEGVDVRLSGQDSARGTFSHRHSVMKIEDSEEEYVPLNELGKDFGLFEVYNSPLSEYGVLGFEYGYSCLTPQSLTIWEAQFGDFNNGAQIIFDQFISSAEDKWNVMNDLVVYLPHGYEGQGPEHSSARVERFLTLSAEFNMQVVNCTTPANLFHVLRRQFYRPFRKPLVIFTPKSLLRHARCVSTIKEFTSGGFKELIDDNNADQKKITKVVLCTGKIYYDLLEEKEKLESKSIAVVRLEQLYPLPKTQLRELIAKYKNAATWLWVQEEPYNMGAWPYIHLEFNDIPIKVIARPASGSPATGSSKFHFVRQRKIIEKTFQECICPNIDKECKMVCIGNRWKSFEREINALKTGTIDSKSISGEKQLN
ncbi:MAG: 2-oxoglutarate dehydrogenase E1 component [Bacteroidales bacterium]|nr:2-oxoglutarate dehydrogenase E1 component [Bacteroidales bacterium]MCF8403042.1 2-oxoglutarate dehydrogenase E1 component [Bacteroidales bacterium]